MSLKTTLIASGRIIRINSRDVQTKDGREFTFMNAVIVGEHTIIDVRVPDDLAVIFLQNVGEEVTALVELSIYRDDVQAQALSVVLVGEPLLLPEPISV